MQAEEQNTDDQGFDADAAAGFDEALEQAIEQAESAASSGGGPKTAEEMLAEKELEVLRAKAEMENVRKRMQRDLAQQLKYANVPLIRELVEVVDNLNRAVDAAQEDGAKLEALREGVELVSQQFINVLANHGCQPIESVGCEFDPNFHEAIAQMPSDDQAAGKVAQEVAKGYVLHDRVVRPSNVIVSTGPSPQ